MSLKFEKMNLHDQFDISVTQHQYQLTLYTEVHYEREEVKEHQVSIVVQPDDRGHAAAELCSQNTAVLPAICP